MNDESLDLDAIEKRLARWDSGDCLSKEELELYQDLIAEVRRLRDLLGIVEESKPLPVGMVYLNFDGKQYGVDINSLRYTNFNGEQFSQNAIEQLKEQLKERYGNKE